MKIALVYRKDIDTQLWDVAIFRSRVPLVYALSDYLDALCGGHWAALIYGNYEAVFPLPLKTKWGFTYVVQPKFCQQLGAFGSNQTLTNQDFIAAIPKKFLRVQLQLNPYFDGGKTIALASKTNYVLPLSEPPTYNKDCRKNLSALRKLPIEYTVNDLTFADVVGVYRDAWGEANQHVASRDYENFISACTLLQSRYGAAHTLSAKNTESKQLLGAAILLGLPKEKDLSCNHLHYVCAGPTESGKPLGIMHGIIDAAIQMHVGDRCFFDFEGSSIPSVAAFYQKFGPENTPFYLLRRGI